MDPGAPSPAAVDRSGRSGRALTALGSRIASWHESRTQDPRWARFTAHFQVLRAVLDSMLTAISDRHATVESSTTPSGEVYAAMRVIDHQIDTVRRIFEWYADKYDQRSDPSMGDALRAADELVRSCWTEPFAVLGRRPVPPGPLTYLDARYDAVATPRHSVPTDLRAPADAVIAEFIRQLPIPVIALPSVAASESWWIVLAAHETGHHLQYELDPTLVDRTRTAMLGAAGDLSGEWYSWALEAFADALSVLLVGPAATWAVADMQYGTSSQLGKAPEQGDRYPPPLVRLAFMGEIARVSGFPDPGPAVEDVERWCNSMLATQAQRDVLTRHLGAVPAVAQAMLGLAIQDVDLGSLCATDVSAYAPGGRIENWATRLTAASPSFTGRDSRPAARRAIAAGVRAHLDAAGSASQQEATRQAIIHDNLKHLLLGCGPEGVLAGVGAQDVSALAVDLSAQLMSLSPTDR